MDLKRQIKKSINEELTKSEVTAMINNRIDSKMSSKEFERLVKEISSTVVSDLFKVLWQRNNMWKSSVSK